MIAAQLFYSLSRLGYGCPRKLLACLNNSLSCLSSLTQIIKNLGIPKINRLPCAEQASALLR